MEYTITGRAKKVHGLFVRSLINYLIFKSYSPFLSKRQKAEKLEKIHVKSAYTAIAVDLLPSFNQHSDPVQRKSDSWHTLSLIFSFSSQIQN
jgi:hypothetical protein